MRRLTPGMFTRFNDALYLSAREQFKDPTRRRAAVVLSDGIDSGRGSATAAQALRALLEASVGSPNPSCTCSRGPSPSGGKTERGASFNPEDSPSRPAGGSTS